MLLDLISRGVLRSQCAARAVEYGLPPIFIGMANDLYRFLFVALMELSLTWDEPNF